MKRLTYTILTIIFFAGSTFAQGGKHFEKREEIKKKQIEFIVKELQLTEKEKKGFIPLLTEFNDKREALHMKKRKNMRNFHQNSLNMSDEDLTKLGDLLVDIDIQIAQLGKTYYEKYKTVLPPMKIILLRKAEIEFKRQLIKKVGHHGKGPK